MPTPVRALMKTAKGDITLVLDPEHAPKTVENFVAYAKSGHYDGTAFHRIIKGFMIQGGGYEAPRYGEKATQKPIENEAKNGLKNARGTIAMARTSAPHSATAQFFINHADNTSLDYPSFDGWGYAVFGRVEAGMDVVDAIANTRTGRLPPFGQDVPVEPVTIDSVTILDS